MPSRYQPGDGIYATSQLERDREVFSRPWWNTLIGNLEQFRTGGEPGQRYGKYLIAGLRVMIDDGPGALVELPEHTRWYIRRNGVEIDISQRDYADSIAEYRRQRDRGLVP